MKLSDFFPSTKKSFGLIVLSVVGVLVAVAVNKYFGIEGQVPRMKDGGSNG